MRLALAVALMVLGCVGREVNAEATPGEASKPTPTVSAPAPGQPVAPAVDDEEAVFQEGLWPGLMELPGCAACGGGAATPADWYMYHGVRVISRSAPRRGEILWQAPPTGTYAAVPDTQPTPDYNVVNGITALFTSQTGALGQSVTGPSDLLDVRQLNLGVSPGYEATIGHYFLRDKNNNDHFVEFTFWGLFSWSKTKEYGGYLVPVYNDNTNYTQSQAIQINLGELTPTPTGNFQGSIRTPFPLAGSIELASATEEQMTLSLAFNYGTDVDVTYRSAMNDFELNGRFTPRGQPDRLVLHCDGHWRRECQPGKYMSYLYGLRLMQIDERFGLHVVGQGPFGNDSDAEIQGAAGNYEIVTHNTLLGFQIGAEMMFRKCRWAWGVQTKVGPYVNFASQNSTIDAVVTDGPSHSAYHRDLAASACQAALIGEVGFLATYKFKPNLVGRAGYDLMWVSGIALAPEQLQFSVDPVNRIGPSGVVFAQGVSLGLEWLW